jgi:hypothetical protein
LRATSQFPAFNTPSLCEGATGMMRERLPVEIT